ncbi:Serine--tRNA ligase [Alphaproteobacteria bacterium]
MHSIRFIREFPEIFDAAMKKRGGVAVNSTTLLDIDSQARGIRTELQILQSKHNRIAKGIGISKTQGNVKNESGLLEEAEKIKGSIPILEDKLKVLENQLNEYLILLPNLIGDDVPYGTNDDDNIEIRKCGALPHLRFTPKQHFELGEQLKQMDFLQSAKISGSRFVTLKDKLALLERALMNFMLDLHTVKFGYTEISPPILVRDHAMFGVGQLPKFAEDSFTVSGGYRLIPTAEVSLTNMVADMIVSGEELPLRFTACTPCFRSEAGSAGKDTRGMIRMHQFTKVELVSITKPQDSAIEHERMLSAAEEVLKQLELPYRVMLLCSQSMGFSSRKTYDIEVWLEGQKCYREISSCSNCHDFQAIRMKAKYKNHKTRENEYVHTLNGSGLAVGRTIVAILENYQQEDGTILVPKVLEKYMHGIKTIS